MTATEINTNSPDNFMTMRSIVLRKCDQSQEGQYVPSPTYKDRNLKRNLNRLWPNYGTWLTAEQRKDPKAWPNHLDVYMPSGGSCVDTFKGNDDYVRCWFIYLYTSLLSKIWDREWFAKIKWLEPRIIECIQVVGAWDIIGPLHGNKLAFRDPGAFKHRSRIALDVIETWAPMHLKEFILAKLPINAARFKKNINFVLPLTMFEFAVASLNKAFSTQVELQMANSILDCVFKTDNVLKASTNRQSLYSMLEVSKIAAEETLRRLVAGKKDLVSEKWIVLCLHSSRFGEEVLSNKLIPLLDPRTISNVKARREAKRAMVILTRKLEIGEGIKDDDKISFYIQPGKHLKGLLSDKTLKADAEKLFDKITKTHPEISDRINDDNFVVERPTFEYEEW